MIQEPGTARPLTVVLADDHALVRAGLRMLVDATPGLQVVAEAADADSALEAVAEHSPDVLALDLAMPGRPPFEIVPELLERHPGTRTVIVTMESDPAMVRHALSLGAAGYVVKEAAGTELIEAIKAAAAGGSYVDPRLGAALAMTPGDSPRPLAALSEREREVLQLIALGNTNAEIADSLGLSIRTIESHRGHLQAKTGLTTRAELVGLALDSGLLADRLRAGAGP